MHTGTACLKEYSLKSAQLAVDDAHREFAVEVRIGADATNHEVDVILLAEVHKKPLHLNDLYLVFELLGDLSQEADPL